MKDLVAARQTFAKEIISRGKISSPRLLRAFAVVPRERFLGEGPWRFRGLLRNYHKTADANPIHLYQDVLVALDEKRALDNGLPSLWARLFDALDIKKNERVVQVGCGTGYYSAILSELVGPLGRVVAIDCEGAFIRRARQALQGYGNVEVIQGDGCKDLGGPADVIIVHAGFVHAHPLWLNSLRPNGRLMLPLTNRLRQGTLFKIRRVGVGYPAEAVGGIEIFPGHGRANTQTDERLARCWEASCWVRSLRRDAHVKDRTCWLHGESSCLSSQLPDCEPRHSAAAMPKISIASRQKMRLSRKSR